MPTKADNIQINKNIIIARILNISKKMAYSDFGYIKPEISISLRRVKKIAKRIRFFSRYLQRTFSRTEKILLREAECCQ